MGKSHLERSPRTLNCFLSLLGLTENSTVSTYLALREPWLMLDQPQLPSLLQGREHLVNVFFPFSLLSALFWGHSTVARKTVEIQVYRLGKKTRGFGLKCIPNPSHHVTPVTANVFQKAICLEDGAFYKDVMLFKNLLTLHPDCILSS